MRPRGIGISGTFTSMNYLTLYRDLGAVEREENWLVGLHGLKSATECIECGLCEGACPQHIAIRDEFKHAVRELQLA